MSDFVYAVSAFERNRGGFPSLPLVNMLAEDVQTESMTALQSRPGLADSVLSMGEGPVRQLYHADGVLDNDIFGLSGSSLYRNSSLLGTVTGDSSVSFAGYSDTLFVNAGAEVALYDGSVLSSISFPDSADVSKIVVGASRLICLRSGTGRFYWSEPLGTTIDPLNFATAENSTDTLKDMLFSGDKLILFGAETVEFWQVTDDSSLPFSPLIGAVLPIGIKNTGAAVNFSKTFAWITNQNEICIGSPDVIISEPELQLKIANSSEPVLWVFYVDDNEYLAVRTDTETWVYGARTQVWSQFTSRDSVNWLPRCYANRYFGRSDSGVLAKWLDDTYTDFDGPLERRFRAWAELTTEVLWLNNVVLRTNPGSTPYIVGLYTDPIVELRTSRDGGYEWQPWKQRTLGPQGKYRKKTFWSSLGQFSYPGVLVELRVTDPVPFRVSGLVLNEPFGGR